MAANKEELLKISKTVGYEIPEKDVEDYAILLDRMKQTLEAVSAMDGQFLFTRNSRIQIPAC
jgi:hypothetical protein